MRVLSMLCSAIVAWLALATQTGCSESCGSRSGCSPVTSRASESGAVVLALRPVEGGAPDPMARGAGSRMPQGRELVAAVRVSPEEAVVVAGRIVKLTATPLDSSGRPLTGRPVRWTSSNSAIATVSAVGAVTGVTAGFVRVTATIEGRNGHAEVTVSAPSAPVASVSVTPSADSLPVGQTWQLTAVARDAAGVVLGGREVNWASSDTARASVSRSGLVTARAPGAVTITASVEGRLDRTSLRVSTDSGGSNRIDSANEPAGYRVVSERAFSTKAADRSDTRGSEGWSTEEHQESGFSIVSDRTAPKSPVRVGQMRYSAGFRDGSSPAQTSTGLPRGTRRLYFSFWMKLSANWQPHESGINKIFHIWLGSPSQNRVFLGFYGQDPQNSRFTVHTQGTPDGAYNYTQNIGGGRATRPGQWQRYEMLLVMNTPGVTDGQAHAWVDGQKVLEARTLRLVGAGESPVFNDVQWSPTWGGNSADVVRETMYMWLDHAYLSTPTR